MKTRQAKKIFKLSFTYWRYLRITGRLAEFRPLPYWIKGQDGTPYRYVGIYNELRNPRFMKALRVTRKFSRPIYEVAWWGTWLFH